MALDNPTIGEIAMFAGNFAPRGWAFCSGQILPISANQALFSIIGTTYGGDGRTTLALPDLRGRVPINTGGTSGTGPGLSTHRLGQRSGQETHLLTLLEMPNHTHIVIPSGTGGALQLSKDNAVRDIPVVGDVPAAAKLGSGIGAQNVNSFGPATNTVDGQSLAGGSTNAATGGSLAHNIMQPYLAVNFIIALTGTFPSRS